MPLYTPDDREFDEILRPFDWFGNAMLAEYGEEGWQNVAVPDALNWLLLTPAPIRYDFEDTESNLAYISEDGRSYVCVVYEAFPAEDEDVPWAVFLVDDFGVRLLPEYSVLTHNRDDADVSDTNVDAVLQRAADELPDRLLSGEFDRGGTPLVIPNALRGGGTTGI